MRGSRVVIDMSTVWPSSMFVTLSICTQCEQHHTHNHKR